MTTKNSIIPAQPGFYLVTPDGSPDGNVLHIAKSPVIAWKIDDDDCVYPLTIDPYGDIDVVILCPNGAIQTPFGGFSDLRDWLLGRADESPVTKFLMSGKWTIAVEAPDHWLVEKSGVVTSDKA